MEERLIGGKVDLLCTVMAPSTVLEIHVVYTPASGELAGRECKLEPGYIKDYLQLPRCPRPDEYALFPSNTLFLDLASASGHMSTESNLVDANGERRALSNPTTPHKRVQFRLGFRARVSCGMRCCSRGRLWMGRASPLFAGDELPWALAAEKGAEQGDV